MWWYVVPLVALPLVAAPRGAVAVPSPSEHRITQATGHAPAPVPPVGAGASSPVQAGAQAPSVTPPVRAGTPSPTTPVYGKAHPPDPSSLEKEIASALPGRTKLDGALTLAARDLASRALATTDLTTVTDPTALRLALARAGAVAPEVAPTVVKGPPARILEHLRKTPIPLAGRVGIGAVVEGPSTAVVILSAPDRLVLDPFPVQVEVGSVHRLSGRLEPPLHQGEVYVRSPGGTPARLSTGGRGAEFSVPIAFAARGRYTLEVIGNGPRGPEVAAILEVFADEEIPSDVPMENREPSPLGPAEGEAWTAAAINEMRQGRNLRPLRVDPLLGKVARRYAEEILATGEFAHRSRISGELSDRLRAAGVRFSRAGENLGQAPDVAGAHRSIVDSPGHLAHLLSPTWEAMGIGVARGRLPNGRETVILVEVFTSAR